MDFSIEADFERGEDEEFFWESALDAYVLYQRILVVVEDIPAMPVTTRHAIHLAIRHDAELHLLSMPAVPVVAGTPDMPAISHHLLNGMAQQVEQQFKGVVQTAIRAGVVCHTHLRWGYTADTILQVADDTRCDLIIMGTPSLRRWQRVMQPNAVKRVSTRARQPVLVIKAS